MIPRLGDKYEIEIETVSRSKDHFSSDEYQKTGNPVAPAIMIGTEIVVEKADISEKKLEAVICRHLGLPIPKSPKKRIFGRFIG